MQKQRLYYLLSVYGKNKITEAEKEELANFISLHKESDLFAEAGFQLMLEESGNIPDLVFYKDLAARVSSIDFPRSIAATVPVHRVHFLRRGFFRYAAAVLVAAGLGTVAYLWTTNKKADQTVVSDNKQLQKDILPGGPKAVLTLADGSIINLDSAASGQLAIQGNARVIKSANGQIIYDLKGISGKNVLWNTMSTPVGGQYQVTLPDGTKVWLNAASSITYPATFVDKERKVKVTGEVYFEVARNKAKPFKVDIDGKSSIEVLGTSFNINSYADEANIKATLFEGSVKVNKLGNSAVLKPGQQAVVLSSQGESATNANHQSTAVKVVSNVDLAQTLAWKNGLFNFNGADLKTVMRQLERWYDIKVLYEGPEPNITFSGKIYRNVNLSDVLEVFYETGIRFRRDGKTLIVL